MNRELVTLAGEVRRLVTLQEDEKQKTLIFERLNLIDKKLAALEGDILKEVKSDLAKLQSLSNSNKEWMGEVGGILEYLLKQDRERSREESVPSAGEGGSRSTVT